MRRSHIVPFLENHKISFEQDVSLSKKTWIKTGGMCSYWITPDTIQQVKEVCSYLYQNNSPFDLVGNTSNIFFHSTYNPEIIVSTVKANSYEIKDDIIICACGVNVMKLAKEMLNEGYAGFYGLVGLPGTVASAVVNNAGCFGCSLSSMLVSADVLLTDGTVKTFTRDDFGYERRSSRFKRGEVKGVVLSVKVKALRAEDKDEEYQKSEETKRYRKTHQEGPAKNLGSVFAKMKRKRNLRNMLVMAVSSIARLKSVDSQRLADKRMSLWLYGYRDLNDYISDKQMNTFVWRDGKAEQKFDRYKEFMAKVFNKLTIEIEERK